VAALEVTPVWVRGDQAQLEQVLANLAVNARDAMPQGGRCTIRVAAVTLDAQGVARYPDLRPGPHAQLAVTDTGHGMSSGVLARVFDPFFTTKGVGKGTGLGLSMAHGLVAQHGGTIVVESEEGHGSIFTIYLPQAPPASSAGTVQPQD
jgi:signal transduction histidine kinase